MRARWTDGAERQVEEQLRSRVVFLGPSDRGCCVLPWPPARVRCDVWLRTPLVRQRCDGWRTRASARSGGAALGGRTREQPLTGLELALCCDADSRSTLDTRTRHSHSTLGIRCPSFCRRTSLRRSSSLLRPSAMSAADVVPAVSPDDRGRVSQPDRASDRCYDLAQASLKCQTHWMVKWNHKRAGTAVQAQCKSGEHTTRHSAQHRREGRQVVPRAAGVAHLALPSARVLVCSPAFRPEIDEWTQCFKRQTDKRQTH